MKLKKKLIIDLLLGICLAIVMFYSITGNFLHELIATLLIVGFFIHVSINRRYYLGTLSAVIYKKNIKGKKLLGFILNIILLIAMFLMAVTSIIISKDLFGFLNINIQNYQFWRISHIILAVIITVSAAIHLLLHKKLIVTYIKNKNSSNTERYGKRIFVVMFTMFSVLLAIGTFKVTAGLIEENTPKHNYTKTVLSAETTVSTDTTESQAVETEAKQSKATEEQVTEPEATEEQTTEYADTTEPQAVETETTQSEATEEQVIEPETTEEQTTKPETSAPTLVEYLSSLNCGGCGKDCSLDNPRCNIGREKAQEATNDYYEIYS